MFEDLVKEGDEFEYGVHSVEERIQVAWEFVKDVLEPEMRDTPLEEIIESVEAMVYHLKTGKIP